jgi:outer membrane protein assembly factor BamB
MRFAAGLAPILVLFAAASAAEAPRDTPDPDWPQFHGPRRDNLSRETGLLKRWPEGGPRLVWKADGLGHGFATVAIAGGMIYTAGNLDADTVVTAMDMGGKRLWRAKNGPACRHPEPAARSTPTVAGGKLYHLNADGDLLCLDARAGNPVWALNILKRFAGKNVKWGLSESPLVDRGRVICCPGGAAAGIVALNAETGEAAWTCAGLGDSAGYASPILVEHGGLRQVVALMGASAVGVAAETGQRLWKYDHPVAYGAACLTPVARDGHLVITGTWGLGATRLKLLVDGDRCAVEKTWHTTDMDTEHGGVVLVGDHLYGYANGDRKKPHLACLDWKTGKTLYASEALKGRSVSLTYADGMLYLVSERRVVALAPATPETLELAGRFELPEQGRGPSWAHPVVFGGRLYLRHGEFLYCHDVRGQ